MATATARGSGSREHRLLKALGLAEVEHNARNNRMRSLD
jgi:hypothetical protein